MTPPPSSIFTAAAARATRIHGMRCSLWVLLFCLFAGERSQGTLMGLELVATRPCPVVPVDARVHRDVAGVWGVWLDRERVMISRFRPDLVVTKSKVGGGGRNACVLLFYEHHRRHTPIPVVRVYTASV